MYIIQYIIIIHLRMYISNNAGVCVSIFQGTPNVKTFSKSITLAKLARFLREAWIVTVSKRESFVVYKES